MNIKEKITEWQESFSYEHCFSDAAKQESAKELELVLFAIDTLTNNQPLAYVDLRRKHSDIKFESSLAHDELIKGES